ncbi:FecR family protein [Chitinophaga nivalis]|uniref:FecR domain-containing protein n=1 Tax=Chitinophaga nivalis TaxID=2991709 RepID=A0ABT3ITH7_9BACT|nr:FecR domain-containing protein [Chitinophaga nivalis]MCW3463032.1 FecR domain-containing protein [Chitinophaga nivalis]MCW3487278.1 FecR domain-containing protein [Chitinophaga nivalis]
MRPPGRFHQLMDKYLTNSITAAEKDQFFGMIRDGHHLPELEQVVDDALATPVDVEEDITLREELFDVIQRYNRPVRTVNNWKRYAAAAAVLCLLAAGTYFWLKPAAQAPALSMAVPHTVVPGTHKAILTLSDGATVALDSAGNQILQQGPTAVKQRGGQLVYDVKGDAAAISYNTLSTPRGGQFQVSLPDGTKVWLNAASSIRYPVAFTGKERRVEITGEVYLEVNTVGNSAADMPFVVVSPHQEVTVLGTYFNINAYEDEGVTRTTLLSGKVQVAVKEEHCGCNARVILKPDQQTVIAHNSAIAYIPVHQVDAEQAIAWKNGYFDFEEERLANILRLLSRWYNVDFEADPAVLSLKFSAVIARTASIEDVLSLLSGTGAVRFSHTGHIFKAY